MRPLVLWFFLALPIFGFSPVLNRIEPAGGKRGTEVQVRFRGERLGEVNHALFYQPGITLNKGLKLAKNNKTKLATASFEISPDAPLGEHSIRLAGPGGITEVRSFWVGDLPVVDEVEPNGTTGEPQRIGLNHTVHGTIEKEDDDCFVVSLKKDQRLSVEVEAMRLGRTMFDASLSVSDPNGFEIATCDDTALLRTDAYLSLRAPTNGDYRIAVREAAYEGNGSCKYRLHIGTFPRPSAVFPPGGQPGETLQFTFLGDPAGSFTQSFTLPTEPTSRFPLFPTHEGLTAPSPHWITVSPLSSTVESRTNHNAKSATPAPAIPCALHGILEPDNPSDWFRFTAKKGQNLVFSALARAHRSPLDPVLSIRNAKGKNLATNDDQGALDSEIKWTCPANGDYFILIKDHLGRCGTNFTYRIEIWTIFALCCLDCQKPVVC